MADSTSRFSDRVANYTKCRPSYPEAILDLLRTECGLTPACIVADIGSGTGILTRLFLEDGNRVFAVEPNKEMREEAERLLGAFTGFVSVDGKAEATTLPDASVDLVTAAQAFHWFDWDRAKVEFRRILRPGGWCVITWNVRLVESSSFLRAYEDFTRKHANDYEKVSRDRVTPEVLAELYRPGVYRKAVFPNRQEFDFDGLRGRVLSSSYMPNENDPSFPPMAADLVRLFEEHARHGAVVFEYETVAYYGRLSEDPVDLPPSIG